MKATTRQVLEYWTKALADEALVASDDEPLITVPIDALRKGRIDPGLAKSVRGLLRTDDEQDDDVMPVMVGLYGVTPAHEHGSTLKGQYANRTCHCLLVPAVLNKHGGLWAQTSRLPWMRREVLMPSRKEDPTVPVVGEMADFDAYLDQHPPGDIADWNALIQWCDALWAAVTGGQLPDGFARSDEGALMRFTPSSDASAAIQEMLKDALERDHRYPLFSAIVEGRRPGAECDTQGESLRLDKLGAGRGMMARKHGLAPEQSVAVAAALSLKNGETLAINGPPGTGKTTVLQSIVASMVVQRAIAGDEPAVIVGTSSNNTAIINIVNGMDEVFGAKGAVTLAPEPWAKRWIDGADFQTYGLYLPAWSKLEDAKNEHQPYAFGNGERKTWQGLPSIEDDLDFRERAPKQWLTRLNATYGGNVEEIETGLGDIQDDLRSLQERERQLGDKLNHYVDEVRWWNTTYGALSREAIEIERRRLAEIEEQKLSVCESRKSAHSGAAVAVRDVQQACHEALSAADDTVAQCATALEGAIMRKASILATINRKGFVEALADAVVIFRGVTAARKQSRLCQLASAEPELGRLFAKELSRPPQAWLERADALVDATVQAHEAAEESRTAVAMDFAARELQAVATATEAAEAAAAAEAALREHRETMQKEIEALTARAEHMNRLIEEVVAAIPDYPATATPEEGDSEALSKLLNALETYLDTTVRFEMFCKAMRYWEGRWLLELEKPSSSDKRQGAVADLIEARLRRWCMLTPCLIATLQSLPKQFQHRAPGADGWETTYLYGFIDLLIVDESGQALPHLGASAGLLASKAVIVGDVNQLEPIATLPRAIDYANAAAAGLTVDKTPPDRRLVSDPGDEQPLSSLMALAQATTRFASETTPEEGVFLSEHRRCRAGIIGYCNDLVYGGRLQPRTVEKGDCPLPPMAWAHVQGEARRSNTSWVNDKEASAIVGWIADHGEEWRTHYGKPLNEIVAVLTPYRAQANLIRGAFKRAGLGEEKITVGTVHVMQGKERPIVALSPVNNGNIGNVDSLFINRKPNLMNVAVSRAKDTFVVVGDMRLFRKGRRSTPTRLLGDHLLKDPGNEIVVDGNYRFTATEVRGARRVSSLEEHRQLLGDAFRSAGSGETVTIVSPWITMNAVKADEVDTLVKQCVGRGVDVWILCDGQLSRRYNGGERAIELLREAGASVTEANGVHNKTLIVGNRITEGSFNWLSASRNPEYARHEASFTLFGDEARGPIEMALNEFREIAKATNRPPASRALA